MSTTQQSPSTRRRVSRHHAIVKMRRNALPRLTLDSSTSLVLMLEEASNRHEARRRALLAQEAGWSDAVQALSRAVTAMVEKTVPKTTMTKMTKGSRSSSRS